MHSLGGYNNGYLRFRYSGNCYDGTNATALQYSGRKLGSNYGYLENTTFEYITPGSSSGLTTIYGKMETMIPSKENIPTQLGEYTLSSMDTILGYDLTMENNGNGNASIYSGTYRRRVVYGIAY